MVITGIECVCSVCGKSIFQEDWGCFGIFPYITIDDLGLDRLDFRPQGAVNNRFFNILSQCPHCGYVAPNLAFSRFGTDKIVSSAEYKQKYVTNDDNDEEVVLQEAYVFILEKLLALSPSDATNEIQTQLFYAYLDAMWFYDEQLANYHPDSHYIEHWYSMSDLYRKKAMLCFEKSNWNFCPNRFHELLMVDVYRRLSMWDKANALIDRLLPQFNLTKTFHPDDDEDYDTVICENLVRQGTLVREHNCLCQDDNILYPIP